MPGNLRQPDDDSEPQLFQKERTKDNGIRKFQGTVCGRCEGRPFRFWDRGEHDGEHREQRQLRRLRKSASGTYHRPVVSRKSLLKKRAAVKSSSFFCPAEPEYGNFLNDVRIS